MRVALISFHTSPLATLGGKDTGGMNVFVREIARELAHRGVQVDVFTRSQSGQTLRIDPRLASGVRVIHVPAGPEEPVRKDDLYQYVPAFAEWMCKFAAQEGAEGRVPGRYDLIHANYWLSGLVAEELRRCWGTRFAMTFHTLAEMKNQIAQRPQDSETDLRVSKECHLCYAADVLTASTQVEKSQLVHLLGAGSSKIRIVPPGVDLSRFNPIEQAYAKSVIGVPRAHKMVLFAGRIERLKGVDTLFRAMALLKQRRADLDWGTLCVSVIGGDPSERGQRDNEEMGRLHALRDELGLSDLITFLGARDQDTLHFYFSAADMLVMPSHYESFGMVALEAMACGTPVIVSDVGGLQELVKHNKTGIRVKVNDPEALAHAIERLLDNPGLRRRMGHAASCYAEDFSWQKIVDNLLSVYREIAIGT
jgi:D-inositol-3-phosphate glycosyltransferase